MAMRRQPEGVKRRKFTARNACGRNPDCHRNKAPLLSDITCRVGATIAAPLSLHDSA